MEDAKNGSATISHNGKTLKLGNLGIERIWAENNSRITWIILFLLLDRCVISLENFSVRADIGYLSLLQCSDCGLKQLFDCSNKIFF